MNRSLTLAALAAALSGPALAQAAPRWQAVEELRIDESAGPVLSDVVSLTVDRAGRIFAAARLDGAIHVFSPTGRPERSFGRRGRGPGEFQGLGRLAWKADTLYAVDSQLRRVTLFTPEGRVARTLSMASPAFDQFGPAVPMALLADGGGLAVPAVSGPYLASGAVTRVPVLRLSARGQLRGTLASLDYLDGPVGYVSFAGGTSYLHRPVSGESLWAMSQDGGILVVVHRTVPRSAEPATFRVLSLRSGGDTAFSTRLRFTPRAVPARVADSLVAEQVRTLSRSSTLARGALERSVKEALGLPRFQPPVTGVVAGRDGTIWLRRERLGQRMVSWLVLDRGGAVAGSLELPADLDLHLAQRDRLWGVRYDADGVPYVVRYAVRPTR